MIQRRHRLLFVVIPVTALALTACSGGSTVTASATGAASSAAAGSSTGSLDGKSADEIADLARAAMAGASSVHLKGTFSDAGNTVDIDSVTTAEGDADARLQLAELGVITVRVVDGTAYLKGDGDFWSLIAGPVGVPEGKWVKASADDSKFGGFVDLASMSKWSEQTLEPQGDLSLVDGKDFDGVPTVGLLDGSGDDASVLYVAAEGDPFPMAIEPKDGSGTLTFTEWNAEVTVTAPPASEVTTL